MTSWRVLLSAPYMQPVADRFRPFFDQHHIDLIMPKVNERLSESELLEHIDQIDGAICGDDRFSKKVLEQAERLKVISKWGTGIDSIDQQTAKSLGIRVCNTPNAFTDPVADSTMGYILAFARQQPWMNQQMKSGLWTKVPCVCLSETTLGIIGVGNIGKAVAKRAKAFGMNILGNDPVQPPADFLDAVGMALTSKKDLLLQSDFISLHCDLNPTSFHIMAQDEFSHTKPSSILINTARGPLVNESDLIKALQDNRLGGAAMDVFEHEPLPEDCPLRSMDNVMLAAHNANSSPTAWDHVHENTLQNLLKGLQEVKR